MHGPANPVVNILNYMAHSNKVAAELPQAPLSMMNVQIRGQRKQLQFKQRKKGQDGQVEQ